MKKVFLILFSISVAVHYTIAQEVISQSPVQEANSALSTKEVADSATTTLATNKITGTMEDPPLSHWSIGIKGGGNYFRIAESTLNRKYQFHFIVGGTLEYTINPLIGIGLEYIHNPFSCPTHTIDVTGSTNDAVVYGSINLSNLLLPHRTGKSGFNVYGDVGIGSAFYNYSLDHAGNQTDQSGIAKVGLNVEYNLSKSLSLGIEGQYRYYNWKLEQVNTIYNTVALTTTLGIRYKFNAAGKKQHARNTSISEYNPTPSPVIVEKVVKDNTAETLDRLKALEAENAALNDKIKKLEEEMLAFSKIPGEKNASFRNIEFEFGSDKLTPGAYATLDQIADILKSNPSPIKLNVAGYTDYIGTAEFNQVLSVKRANAVRTYLLAKNAPSSSIIITGYGKENPIAPNETAEGRQKNRRVEFQITQ